MMNEPQITRKDWLGVLLVGVVFSAFLSLLAYHLLGISPFFGAIFGVILGFFITFFSFVFISAMNGYLLPRIPKPWWNSIAAIFSFLSGFFGTISTYALVHITSIHMVPFFQTHPYQSASIVGILTYLIGALIYRFVKMRNEKDHIDALFVHSRVSSLETQLNPHFLFNALNSLAELIHQNPDKAEAAVLKISTFLRNTMSEKALIPLSEELRNVHDYIDLENMRFNGSIALEIKADENVLKHLIPKFSIQLLCENAIKHGMKKSIEPFTITISITLEKMLRIRVSNNGTKITSAAFGIGLSNLRERLSHLCHGNIEIVSFDPPSYLITLKDCHEYSHR